MKQQSPLVPRFASHAHRRSSTGIRNLRRRGLQKSNNSYTSVSKKDGRGVQAGNDRVSVKTHASGWLTDDGESVRNSFWHGMRGSAAPYQDMRLSKGVRRSGKSIEYKKQQHSEDSEVTAINRPTSKNFFEAVGTVRMEAFVQGLDRTDLRSLDVGLNHQTQTASQRHLRSRNRSLDRYPKV